MGFRRKYLENIQFSYFIFIAAPLVFSEREILLLLLFIFETMHLLNIQVHKAIIFVLTGITDICLYSENIIFIVLAIDRLMAVLKPVTTKWNKTLILKIYLSIVCGVVIPKEVINKTLEITIRSCEFRRSMKRIIGYYSIIIMVVLILNNLLAYLLLVGLFSWKMLKSSDKDYNKKLKAIVKLALISFEASLLNTLTLIPQFYYQYSPFAPRYASLYYLCSINVLANSFAFIVNNRFLRGKLFRRNRIGTNT